MPRNNQDFRFLAYMLQRTTLFCSPGGGMGGMDDAGGGGFGGGGFGDE